MPSVTEINVTAVHSQIFKKRFATLMWMKHSVNARFDDIDAHIKKVFTSYFRGKCDQSGLASVKKDSPRHMQHTALNNKSKQVQSP